MRRLWSRIRQTHVPEGAWTDYHENSKTSRQAFSAPRGDTEVAAWMASLDRTPFETHDVVGLPKPRTLTRSLGDVLERRRSSGVFGATSLDAETLSTLLHAAYGVSQRGAGEVPLRTVPSAGALYPLEVYVALGTGHEVDAGLYAYVPQRAALCRSAPGDLDDVASCMMEEGLARSAAAIVLVVAMFERSLYKYGERGYRFVLLEAGHVAQNLHLACEAVELRSLPYGGFIDREIDRFLGFDGVQMSCVHAIMIGGPPGL